MKPNLLAVYGILKRGYALDLAHLGATFVSEATIKNAQLYYLGNRMGVGLRFEATEVPAQVEIWEIPDRLWEYLDNIESVRYGVYKRIKTFPVMSDGSAPETWVYAHCYYDKDPKQYNDPIRVNKF